MILKKSSIVGFSFLLLTVGVSAFAGGVSQGGGFYGKTPGGEWVLVDELEEGAVKDPRKLPEFEKVERLLNEITVGVPQFAEELRAPLQKTWHFVDFALNCESPRTPLNTELTAGACQDEQDVWIEKSKFDLSKSKLIIHELLQGVRLAHNQGYDVERVTPAQVRAVFRALGRAVADKPEELQQVLSFNGFGTYPTASEIAKEAAPKLHIVIPPDLDARASKFQTPGFPKVRTDLERQTCFEEYENLFGEVVDLKSQVRKASRRAKNPGEAAELDAQEMDLVELQSRLTLVRPYICAF